MCIVYSPDAETITFLHKGQGYKILVWKSKTTKGWQYEALGRLGERPTKSQALDEARLYIINS